MPRSPRSPAGPARRRLRLLPLAVAALASAGCATWYAIFLAFGDGIDWIGAVNALGFFWGLLAFGCATLWLWQRQWALAAALVVIGIAILVPGGRYVPLPTPQAPPGALRLRVVTASLRQVNRDMVDAARVLAATRPDILVMQEVSDVPGFVAAFGRDTGQSWHLAGHGQQIVLSRWPVTLAANRTDYTIIPFMVASPAGPIALWNVHASKDYGDKARIGEFTTALRDAYVAAGARGMIVGDFNATPWNEGYRRLTGLTDDAFARAGWGPGFTAPTRARRIGMLFAFLRIDHVMADRRFVPLAARVGEASNGADHYPVIVDYAFTAGDRRQSAERLD